MHLGVGTRCKEFDEHTVSILDENTMLRAGLGEQVTTSHPSSGVTICSAFSTGLRKKCTISQIRRRLLMDTLSPTPYFKGF